MTEILYAALPEFLGGLATALALLSGGALWRAFRRGSSKSE
ncbi:hypothetical protein [Streptomyces bambusae]|nr:hypothetical protein [Streptomyces bambusae]